MEKPNNKDIWKKGVKPEENPSYWKGMPIINIGKNTNTKKFTVVELFSGCGGTSKGFEMANYHIALGVDIHEPSIKTFGHNHPYASTIMGDIKKVDPKTILEIIPKNIDVLIAGIPCQGFSINNRKRSDNDERNFLYKEFVRFAKVLKPKAVMIENVSGIKSAGGGEFVKAIKEELGKLLNTEIKNEILYAPDYGVPQKRKRMIFIGIRNKKFDFSKIIKTHGPGTNREYVNVREAIGDLPPIKAGEETTEYTNPPLSEYQKLMRKNQKEKLTNHIAPKHPESTIIKIRKTKQGEPLYSRFKQRIRLAWNDLSPTQVSGGIRSQFQFAHPELDRGETIREKCRLQSFPDDFEVLGGVVQSRVQIGNAVPPLLAKAIAEALKEYLN